jgi:hemoglobin-like flavoprotein
MLFTSYPEVEPLFRHSRMTEQGEKLFKSLVLVVDNLRQPNTLTNSLKGLGTRHIHYGVLPQHYPMVGQALLKTFEQFLGNEWTPPVQQAWATAYQAVSQIMLEGAN